MNIEEFESRRKIYQKFAEFVGTILSSKVEQQVLKVKA
jgi:hypothetical protein